MSIYWDNTIDEESLTLGITASNHSLVAEFSSTTDNALIKIFTDSLNPSQTINGYALGASNNNNTQSLTIGQIMSGSNYPIIAANDFIIHNHNIGINNPYPNYTLDVYGSGYFSSNLYINGPSLVIPTGNIDSRPYNPIEGTIRYNTDSSSFEGFGPGSSWGSLGGVINTAQTTYIKAELYPNANDNNLRFVNSNIESMRITSNGYVGIGTFTPNYTLDVNGYTNISCNLIVGGRIVGLSNSSLFIGSQSNMPTTIDGSIQVIGNAYVLGTLIATKIKIGAAGVLTNIVGITSLDTVSINELTVITPINGTITGNININQINSLNTQLIDISTDSSNYTNNQINNITTLNNVTSIGNNSQLMLNIISSNNVIHGNAHITSNLLIDGMSIFNSNMNVNGTIYTTGGVVSLSDQTIKCNLIRIPNALDKISQLTGYTYNRTDNNYNIRESGLIAQDVLKILPEVVQKNTEYNDLLTIAYGNMAGLWVEAFKEMQDRINVLELKIESLTNKTLI